VRISRRSLRRTGRRLGGRGNLRLYEYLKRAAPELPETLEEMAPLFAAVGHGCQAGRQQEALDEVYRRWIQRGQEFYNLHKLGAFGSDLAALTGFFDHLWDRPSTSLTRADRAFVLLAAGFNLHALGRLVEAVQPAEAALAAYLEEEDWAYTARDASNLSELTRPWGGWPAPWP
jgi:hypothetical protein